MGRRWRLRAKVRTFDRPGILQVEPAGLEGQAGWPAAFGRQAPLEVEVGPGKGEFLMEMARRRPDHDFIGIEINRVRVLWMECKLSRAGVPNVRLVKADAFRLLGSVFAESQVQACYLNFPDPWPKRRHEHRRLICAEVLDGLVRILVPGGSLTVVTDVEPYARHGLELLEARPGLVENALGPGVRGLAPRRLPGDHPRDEVPAPGALDILPALPEARTGRPCRQRRIAPAPLVRGGAPPSG